MMLGAVDFRVDETNNINIFIFIYEVESCCDLKMRHFLHPPVRIDYF